MLSSSNLKYLSHVIVQDYINNEAHIVQIRAEYLQRTQDIALSHYLTFDYTATQLVIEAVDFDKSPLGFRDAMEAEKAEHTVFVRVVFRSQGLACGDDVMVVQLWLPGPEGIMAASRSEGPQRFGVRWIHAI